MGNTASFNGLCFMTTWCMTQHVIQILLSIAEVIYAFGVNAVLTVIMKTFLHLVHCKKRTWRKSSIL